MVAPFQNMPTDVPFLRQKSADKTLSRLIWLYFWLLIFEGALRKWVLPGLSAPLLIIRDPVALAIIVVAIRDGTRMPEGLMPAILGLGGLFGLLGLVQVVSGLVKPSVVLFGLRTYFLHLPLVFIMGSSLRAEDVRSFVRWTLIIAVPMTVLMAVQFVSPADSWINKGVGEEGTQLRAARDHIRAAGTFSFVSGTIAFVSLMLSCCLSEFFVIRKAGWNLNHAVLASCILVSMTAGSRGLLFCLSIVVITFLICLMLSPRSIKGATQAVAVGAISLVLLSFTELFHEGIATMTERTLEASTVEGGSEGFIGRISGDLTSPFEAGLSVPVYGGGIGLGTNVGASLSTGSTDYLMAEGEWGRIIGEAGLIGGGLFIGFRTWIVVLLGLRSLHSAKQGNMLPLLLFGAGASPMWNGQWGQATSLGFAVFVCGLVWAASESRSSVTRPALGPAELSMRRSKLLGL